MSEQPTCDCCNELDPCACEELAAMNEYPFEDPSTEYYTAESPQEVRDAVQRFTKLLLEEHMKVTTEDYDKKP